MIFSGNRKVKNINDVQENPKKAIHKFFSEKSTRKRCEFITRSSFLVKSVHMLLF